MQPKYEVADVLRHAHISDASFSIHQQKTLRAITQCRTAALGGHVDACSECGTVHFSYNSCRNRHCPKCQGHKREEWIQKREADLLPCTYYHVVFTLPQELKPLALHQPRVVYDALFASAWATLNQFGNREGLQLGMIAVLHTWGQNLFLHPHLHCIVPGGGVDANGRWKQQLRSNKFLFSVKSLGKVYRAKYVQQLRSKGIDDKALIESLFAKQWVVYAKRPFGGPQQVIGYLGRYTHKVAISNHRIVGVDESQVSFRYKDYKAAGAKSQMTLSNQEFARRFAQHILPPRFIRIRHYGIVSSTWKRGKLQTLQSTLQVVRKPSPVNTLLRKCPCCKTGILITIEVFGKRGPPQQFLLQKQKAPVA